MPDQRLLRRDNVLWLGVALLALAGLGVPALIYLYKRAAREDARDEQNREDAHLRG